MCLPRMDCRCCRGAKLNQVFDLGEQPLANAFLSKERLCLPEKKYPLILMECADCGHVQLGHVVEAKSMYEQYSFVTSSSLVMTKHFSDLMNSATEKHVGAGGLVVEIGSNDGTALASILRGDVRRIGVDPAENLNAIANTSGVNTLCEFFDDRIARQIKFNHGEADLIVACNVLGHIDDLDGFCAGVRQLMSPRGALIVEVPNVACLLFRAEFDTIYHEHLSYFSIKSLAYLFGRHGLKVDEVEHQHTHGGSVRITVSFRENNGNSFIAENEQSRDWSLFNQRCSGIRSRLRDWITEQCDSGKSVWGYGAPAKGTVMLNYCDIGTDLVPVVVDSTEIKQGKYVPGTHQLICKPENLLNSMPDYAIVLAWNHFHEICKKESKYANRGGKLRSVCP